MMKRLIVIAALAAATLSGCAQSAKTPDGETGKQTSSAPKAAPLRIYAASGPYKLDPNHASLTFAVNHLGLSNYIVRVAKFDATMNLDANSVSRSTVTFKVDPASVQAGYRGDYRATHKGSSFGSWDEALSRDANFLNTRQFPEAGFQSTSVEVTGPNTARVSGDLTLLGQTRPATFDVTWIGSTAAHPMTKGGAFGLSAVGVINRSDYGMSYLLGADGRPDIVGNAVTITFNGEFLSASPPAAR
jgi:polyisoprenoid-binding protein YceI